MYYVYRCTTHTPVSSTSVGAVCVQVVQSLLQYNCSVERQWKGPGGQSCSLLGVVLQQGQVDMLSLLASVGAVCTSDDLKEMFTTEPRTLDLLHEIMTELSSLQQLCRRTIRRQLSCDIRHEVKRLPLPNRLQQYIVEV